MAVVLIILAVWFGPTLVTILWTLILAYLAGIPLCDNEPKEEI